MQLYQDHFSHSKGGIDELCGQLSKFPGWKAIIKPTSVETNSDDISKGYEWIFVV